MAVKERLIALDRKMLGPSHDMGEGGSKPWVPVLGLMTPAVAGGSAAIASVIDRAAGVGVLIGLVAAVPICVLARESGRRTGSSHDS